MRSSNVCVSSVCLTTPLSVNNPDGGNAIVEAGVLDTIDEVVKEQVKAELPRVIPKSLQDEVAVHRKQLQEVQRALHNSYVTLSAVVSSADTEYAPGRVAARTRCCARRSSPKICTRSTRPTGRSACSSPGIYSHSSIWTVSAPISPSILPHTSTHPPHSVITTADSAAQLLQDYDMLDVTQSRERNLNRFMQFCGVTYQLVRFRT